MDNLQPLVQRDMAVLEHRPDLDRKLPLAGAAAIQSDPATLHAGNPRGAIAAGADRAERPDDLFHQSVGCGFVMAVWGGKNGHRSYSLTEILANPSVFVNYIIAETPPRHSPCRRCPRSAPREALQ